MADACYGTATRLRDLEGFLQHQERGEDENGPDLAGAIQINGRLFRVIAFDREALSGQHYFKLKLRPEDGASVRRREGADDRLPGARRGA